MYCNLQLGQLREIEKELTSLGYSIIAISPDSPAKLAENIEKNQYKYLLASDSKLEAARAFGIAFKVDDGTINKLNEFGIDIEEASGETHHLLLVPSVFIISKEGIIQFKYVNTDYTKRLNPKDLLKAAHELIIEVEPQQ